MNILNSIGQRSSVNKELLCNATIRSMRSHLLLFQRNKIELSEEYVHTQDLQKVIDGLKDKKNRPISSAYKIQIAATLKHMYNVKIKTKKWTKEMQKPKVRSTEFMQSIEKYVTFAAKAVANQQTLDDITMYDTCLTILIIASTSLRIEEVHSLKLEHFKDIRKYKTIKIRSKGSKIDDAQRDVVYNKLLESCYVIIAKNRELYKNKARRITHVNNRFRSYRPNRLDADYITVSSIQQMRRKLQEISALLNISDKTKEPNGFTAFRKYITTLLISNGESNLARYMNNHSKLQTTTKYYDLSSQINTNDVQKELIGDLPEIGNTNDDNIPVGYSYMPPTPDTPGMALGTKIESSDDDDL